MIRDVEARIAEGRGVATENARSLNVERQTCRTVGVTKAAFPAFTPADEGWCSILAALEGCRAELT